MTTLSDSTMNLLREAFEKALNGLIEQGSPGYDYDHGICVYENDNGKRCAVGQLMTPSEIEQVHDLALNGNSVRRLLIDPDASDFEPDPGSILGRIVALEIGERDLAINYLMAMQHAHDQVAEAEEDCRPDWNKVFEGGVEAFVSKAGSA